MAIDIAGLKAAAAGSEGDKVTWYATQLKNGYTDAEITAAVDKALGSSYATAKAGTKEGDAWNYLQDKAAEKIIKDVSTGSAKDKAIAYNALYQGAGLTNDEIQQNIQEVLGKPDPDQMRALLGMAGARRAAQLPTGQAKADYVKQMIGYGYTPQEIQSYITTGVGQQTPENMAELFRLAGVQLPGSNQQQQQQQSPTDYQGVITGAPGVDFKGSTGLREAYGPYVLDYLSRASALLGLRDAENYQPIKFGTAQQGGTYGGDTAKALADLQTQRANMMGMGTGANATPAHQPYQYSFTPKSAKRGGIMSLVEGYSDGGMTGTQVVPSTFDAPDAFSPTTYSSTYTAPTNAYTGPGAGGITTGTFDQNAISQFTNPYATAVTDPQVREAKRQAQLASQAQAAKFTQAGAFGGTRNILAENEIGRNLATQVGDIYGKGQKEAYDAALRAFEAEQGRKLQAATATEQARQEAGRQGLTGAETAARYGLEASRLGEQSKQFAANLGLQTAQSAAQYDQQARELQQRAEEAQARGDQFAASLALQQLQEAQRAAEAARTFEYTQARDTYLDPFRELGYASQLLQGLPTSATPTGVSPSGDALKALLASYGVLFPGG